MYYYHPPLAENASAEKRKKQRVKRSIFKSAAIDLSENSSEKRGRQKADRITRKTKAKLCAARGMRAGRLVKQPDVNLAGIYASKIIFGEFDSGSERTLAAWIRHASRTGHFR